jgi:hypothetical protein
MDAPAPCSPPFDSCFAEPVERLRPETSVVLLFPLLNRSTVDLPIRTLKCAPGHQPDGAYRAGRLVGALEAENEGGAARRCEGERNQTAATLRSGRKEGDPAR